GYGGTRHILEADNPAAFVKDVSTALGAADTLHIDVDGLAHEEIITAVGQIPPAEVTRIRIGIRPEHRGEPLLERRVANGIAARGGRSNLGIGESDPAVKERFRILAHNLRLKNKTYEMEIIESLLTDAGAENRKYRELKSRYDNLKAASGVK